MSHWYDRYNEETMEDSIYKIDSPAERRSKFLDEVEQLVNDSRNKDYGDARENFERIADLWSTYLNKQITVHDVAALMILHKLSRLKQNGKHRDSWLDIAGYAGLAGTMI